LPLNVGVGPALRIKKCKELRFEKIDKVSFYGAVNAICGSLLWNG